jgi:DNA invertase Pin-like site-specific DNA recombinase
MVGTMAEFEPNVISERTKAGLAAARRRGRSSDDRAILDAYAAEIAATSKAQTAVRLGSQAASPYPDPGVEPPA